MTQTQQHNGLSIETYNLLDHEFVIRHTEVEVASIPDRADVPDLFSERAAQEFGFFERNAASRRGAGVLAVRNSQVVGAASAYEVASGWSPHPVEVHGIRIREKQGEPGLSALMLYRLLLAMDPRSDFRYQSANTLNLLAMGAFENNPRRAPLPKITDLTVPAGLRVGEAATFIIRLFPNLPEHTTRDMRVPPA